jgi:hypothetical protein
MGGMPAIKGIPMAKMEHAKRFIKCSAVEIYEVHRNIREEDEHSVKIESQTKAPVSYKTAPKGFKTFNGFKKAEK